MTESHSSDTPRPIRVLRVIHNLRLGGVQNHLLKSILQLRPLDVDCEVCVIGESGEFESQFVGHNIPVHHIPFGSRLDPTGLYRLRRLALAGRFHIAHAHMYAANMATTVALVGSPIRVINSYHSIHPVRGKSQTRMLRWTLPSADQMVAVSRAVEESLLDLGVPAEKIEVLHNGVEIPDVLTPLDPQPEDAGESGAPLRLVWAGRFVKQKRVERMLDIVEELKARGVPVKLTLVGDGPTRERIERGVADRGLQDLITFAGFQPDIRPWLVRNDLFLSTSEREGFPNALLECCSMSRAFIASDIAPHTELLDGTNAGRVFGEAIGPWVDGLAELANHRDQIEAMSRAAYELAKQHSMAANAKKTRNLYDRLLQATTR